MNLYLLNLIGKWIGVLFVSILSFFGHYEEKEVQVFNTHKNMSLDLTTEIISYQTEVKYNNEKPNGEKTVIVAGENGYLVKNNENGSYKIIKNPVNEVVEVGTYVKPVPAVTTSSGAGTVNSYIGKMTMYYNCPNRNYCRTSGGHDLKASVFYNDPTYGTVRVLSAATSKFPLGTIIEVTNTPRGTFYGIVLDTGGSMIAAMQRGEVHIDLAVDAAVEKAYTYSNVGYNVKRYGY